jgi:adenylate kinase family enzyme
MKIHLLGPSGSGTSTLGKMIADKFNFAWFDADNFY